MKKLTMVLLLTAALASCGGKNKAIKPPAKPFANGSKTAQQLANLSDIQKLQAVNAGCKQMVASNTPDSLLMVNSFLTIASADLSQNTSQAVVNQINNYVSLEQLKSNPSATCADLISKYVQLGGNQLALNSYITAACNASRDSTNNYNYGSFQQSFVGQLGTSPTIPINVGGIQSNGRPLNQANFMAVCQSVLAKNTQIQNTVAPQAGTCIDCPKK